MAGQGYASSWSDVGEVGSPGSYVQTFQVGGSRWPTWAQSAFNPIGLVGRSNVQAASDPTVPPLVTQVGAGSMGVGSAMPSAGDIASANPWNPKASPLVFVVGGVLLIVVFHHLYYRRGRK
jgi:hypothetical protein